jgi:hypothetical protein
LTGPLTLAWVEGTYLSTTVALSRHEHVPVAGLGGRARATMVVDDSAVRWEREGADAIRVAGPLLLGVSVEGSLKSRLLGRAQLVLVSWSPDDGEDSDRQVTRFLPRARADSAALVSAVNRLMDIGPSLDESSTPPEGAR